MSHIPYIKFYPADYLTDTAHLNTLEHGAYFLLLMNYWQRGKPLPAEENKLARIAGLSSEQWSAIGPTLLEFFEKNEEGYMHKRVEKELSAVRDKSQKARISAQSKRTLSERSANGKRKGTYTDTDTDIDKKKDSVPDGTGAEAPDAAAEMDRKLFSVARQKFGKSCGGQITKLKRARGVAVALEDVNRAPDGAPGLEYLAGILRSNRNGREQIDDAFEWLDEQRARQGYA